jgi:MraZ protein
MGYNDGKNNKLNRFVKEQWFYPQIYSWCKSGRYWFIRKVLIPKDFFWQYHQGSRFSSAVNIVEIWDKDLYETSINGRRRFCRFSRRVMGNINGRQWNIIIRFCFRHQ